MAARAKQTRQKAAGTQRVRDEAPRAKRKAVSKSAAKEARAPVDANLEEKCKRLEGELAAARERVAELEQLNEEAINRIDWVIDSLQTLLESQTKK
jgi:hypothetical protein